MPSVFAQASTRRVLGLALVFAAGLAVSAFSVLRGIDPFDEGLALQAAARVGEGQLPYHDFVWAYGPAQPYLLGGLHEIFGESLVVWRILRVLVNGAVAVTVYSLVRPRAGLALALGAAAVAACAMAQPLSANPLAGALLFALLAVAAAASERPRVVAAGVLTALAAAWRLDFGVCAGLACLTALALRGELRPVLRYSAVAAGGALLAYLPFLIAAGPADMWEALVAKGLRDREYWTLPFPLEYGDDLTLRPRELKDLLAFYVPALLIVGVALAAAAAAVRRHDLPTKAGPIVLGICFLVYLNSRADAFHETPVIVTLALLLPLVWLHAPRWLGAPGLVLLALLGAYVVSNRADALLDPPRLERLRLDVGDGVRVPRDEAEAIPQAVRAVRAAAAPGEPIYVVTLRSDLVRIGNPLFYVLAQRPNVLDRDFDLLTSAPAQRDLVERLEGERPRAIVRWTDPESARREDNERGEPSGSRLLDEWLAREYRTAGRFGHYTVLVPA